MNSILSEERFNFIKEADKDFINEFNRGMNELGYDYGDNIGSGFCWGRYMLIYSKTGQKSKKVVARIYIREDSIVLRLFLNGIDTHREYIEKAQDFISEPFVNTFGKCNHCRNDKEGTCKFRKSYTLSDILYEKCNGITFEFWNPVTERTPEYIKLLTEFYPDRKKK
ncbi:MAG TPA: hypothetical protein VN258_14430 [Mobilitalea sp.]|nr:hypothetical protein [Mobilitalea sp.]